MRGMHRPGWLVLWGVTLLQPTVLGGFSSWLSSDATLADDNDQTVWVSPIVNRELEASVVAHSWPFTLHNVFCEAWAYHKQRDWAYLDRLVDLVAVTTTPISSSEHATRLVLQAVSKDSSLMEYALSMRAYSPQCELHRGLARQLLLSSSSSSLLISDELGDAFCQIGNQLVITDPSDIASLSPIVATLEQVDLLPGEVPRGGNNGDDTVKVVLYANMGTTQFVSFYKALVESQLPFVVRHLGNVRYEEIGGSPTVLQGYGVRLDIRNVEYRVFDDDGKSSSQADSLLNVTALEHITTDFLAGVNVSTLTSGLSEKEALEVQRQLWKRHEAQQLHSQIIPPTWQRRQLPLQAAVAVATAGKDALLTLEEISQNLPSVASTLVHTTVPEHFIELAQHLETVLPRGKDAALFVNGRAVPIDRPSFNVFELINMIQEEQEELDGMHAKLGKYMDMKALQQVLKAWRAGEVGLTGKNHKDERNKDSSGKAFRVDVGRGWKQSVMYLNDIEKDVQYKRWPRQVQQILYSMQYGAPPSVRRNLFTFLAVMDPLEDTPHPGMALALQLMESSYPVRLGILFVNAQDLAECSAWVANTSADDDTPCPVSPLLASNEIDMDDMKTIPATAQAAHKLFAFVCTKYAGEMVASAYLEYWVNSIGDIKAKNDGSLTMHDLLLVHAKLMSTMGLAQMGGAITEGVAMLKSEEALGSDVLKYGKALRFALNKGIEPGMSFINGRPVPSASEDDPSDKMGSLFMEEQSHIFHLIASGEINDYSPKSVYAKLLTGEGVFKRLHPLLTGSGSGKNVYTSLVHGFGPESLLIPPSQSPSEASDAVFVVEAVFDFESSEGRELAANFISTMDALPSTIGDGDDKVSMSLAYRILPTTSTTLCPILSSAGKIGASSLVTMLNQDRVAQQPLDDIIDTIPDVSDDVRKLILSNSVGCSAVSADDIPSKAFIVANGRMYSIEGTVFKKADIELLLTLELGKAKAVTKLLSPHVSFGDVSYFDAIGQSTSILAQSFVGEQKPRGDIESTVLGIEDEMGLESNPFRFSWNDGEDDETLNVKIVAVVDPVSEPAQRMAPLLRAIRDHLKLPLCLILAPKSVLDGDDKIPITSYYRFVADPTASAEANPPKASFTNLPTNHVLTLRMDVPESWNVQQTDAIQDTDNLRCDIQSGCSDEAQNGGTGNGAVHNRKDLTRVEYGLSSLLIFGQCYDATNGSPPNGLQLTLSKKPIKPLSSRAGEMEIGPDGSIHAAEGYGDIQGNSHYSDTLVMKNVGYWQLRANPGVWNLNIDPHSRGAQIFDMVEGTIRNGKLKVTGVAASNATKTLVMKDFVSRGEFLMVKRRPGYEKATLFYEAKDKKAVNEEEEVINVFSLATGHLYERFLKIMMLSVTKRTSSKVKFWLFENFLSPTFKASATAMAESIGCEVEFVTYKWPEWIRAQSEKQRIIWGYKILFLDVLFPLNVKKIIYVDADQVVRGDLKELWDLDLQGAPYGYTPFCTSRETTLGFQFWRSGFWKSHLRDKPYHISALYVVDLEKFRRDLVGDQLRSIYQQLSSDPNSLANLDQDLPNYAQHQVPIFSLPQEWLWCESWCSDETKATAKTIDLCNNPLHKEPKVSMAKRIISGELFNESWVELDAEVESYEKEFLTQSG